MPVLPSRTLKKYSSLATDSPSVEPPPGRSRVWHSNSAPVSGNKLVSALFNIRSRWSPDDHGDSPEGRYDLGDSYESDHSRTSDVHARMMSSPNRRTAAEAEDAGRPHLSPYFQHRKRTELNSSTEEDRKKFEEQAKPQNGVGKRPTLKPFFNANHHFMKALRRMGPKDNFSRLKPGRDD